MQDVMNVNQKEYKIVKLIITDCCRQESEFQEC